MGFKLIFDNEIFFYFDIILSKSLKNIQKNMIMKILNISQAIIFVKDKSGEVSSLGSKL